MSNNALVVDPFGFNQSPLKADVETDVSTSQTGFLDVVGANLGYTYDPIIEYVGDKVRYGNRFDKDFDPINNMEGYEQFASTLIEARNSDHMESLKRQIRESSDRRKIMADAGFVQNVVAGVFDPINLLALPFGGAGIFAAGARATAAGVMTRGALRTGVGVATLQAGQEAIKYPFDPLATVEESALNVGAAFVTGGLIGGLVSIPAARKAKVELQTTKDIEEMIEVTKTVTQDDAAKLGKPEERKFGTVDEQTLEVEAKTLPKFINDIQKRIDRVKARLNKTPQKLDDVALKTEQEGSTKVYHGTNLSNKKGVVDAESPKPTMESFINKRGELVLRPSVGDFDAQRGNGVSFGETFEVARNYTYRRDNYSRDPSDNKDGVIFVIDKDALPPRKEEAMGESVVYTDADIIIPKGKYEVLTKKDFDRTGKQTPIKQQDLDNLEKAKARAEADLIDLKQEKIFRRMESVRNFEQAIDDPYRLADSWFTNSWIYNNLVPTPMKATLQGNIPTTIKKKFVDAFGDNAQYMNLNKIGLTNGHSAYVMAKVREGEYVQVMDALISNFARLSKKGNGTIADFAGIKTPIGRIADTRPRGFDDFAKEVNRKYIMGEKGATDLENESIQVLRDFYKKWGERLEDVGLIGTRKFFENSKIFKERRLAEAVKIRDELRAKEGKNTDYINNQISKKVKIVQKLIDEEQVKGLTVNQLNLLKKLTKEINEFKTGKKSKTLTPRQRAYLVALEERTYRYTKEIDELTTTLDGLTDVSRLAPDAEDMFPRYWDRDAIIANKEKFTQILQNWYERNPKIVSRDKQGKYQETDMSPNPRDIRKRAEDTVDKILGLDDLTAEPVSFFGMGKSKHFKHRELDIPNSLVFDFIQNDPIVVMKAYTNRVAPRYEYAKKFNSKSLDEVLEDIEDEMMAAGKSTNEINAVRKDFIIMYDRVVGTVFREPDTWSNKLATVMRDAAQLNYLGSAGFSTLPDMAKIVMEHELGTIMKVLTDVIGDQRVRMNAYEGRIAGEIMDIINGSSHMRVTEELSNDVFSKNFYDKTADEAKNVFYMLNLLAPFTRVFKQMDSMCRAHTIVDMALRRADPNGKLSDLDLGYMSRYNIGSDQAKQIKQLVDMNIIENSRPDGSGVWLLNTEKWPTDAVFTQLRDDVRGSLNSGIMNTILMGTPADKPVLVDGIFHIPMRVAGKLGMKEDPKVRGYARIENGLMGMPFQFMSYSFAAANKITAAYAQGQVRNRFTAMALSVGLGYMSLSIKYNQPFNSEGSQRYWEQMSWQDKLGRSIDQSGLLALFTDQLYTAMSTSAALGGPDLGMGIINPKVTPEEGDYGSVATGYGGAGVSIADDLVRNGLMEFMSGNFGEGSKNILENLPFMRLWFLKGMVSATGDAMSRSRF